MAKKLRRDIIMRGLPADSRLPQPIEPGLSDVADGAGQMGNEFSFGRFTTQFCVEHVYGGKIGDAKYGYFEIKALKHQIGSSRVLREDSDVYGGTAQFQMLFFRGDQRERHSYITASPITRRLIVAPLCGHNSSARHPKMEFALEYNATKQMIAIHNKKTETSVDGL